MRNDQLSGYLAFFAVARHSSFTTAAADLEMSPSAVSQSVSQLETRLGVRLFDRTTRRVKLTEAGTMLLERVGPAIEELSRASEFVAEHREQPSGTLRLNTPHVACRLFVEPILEGFLRKHPTLSVEICVEDSFADIVGEGFDAGIRLGESLHKDMIALKLGAPQETLKATKIAAFEPILCASPDFVGRLRMPKDPAETEELPWVVLSRLQRGDRWTLVSKRREILVHSKTMTICNSSLTVRELVMAGLGIGVCPDYQVARALAGGELMRILPEWKIAGGGIWAIYPHDRTPPLKVRKLIELAKRMWR